MDPAFAGNSLRFALAQRSPDALWGGGAGEASGAGAAERIADRIADRGKPGDRTGFAAAPDPQRGGAASRNPSASRREAALNPDRTESLRGAPGQSPAPSRHALGRRRPSGLPAP